MNELLTALKHMEDRTHSGLIQIANNHKANLERLSESLNKARGAYDGQTILAAIVEIQTIYGELSGLVSEDKKQASDEHVERTRARFMPEVLEQNRSLSQAGSVSMTRSFQCCDRAAEALGRALQNITERKDFEQVKGELEDASLKTAEALHYCYLITLPDK